MTYDWDVKERTHKRVLLCNVNPSLDLTTFKVDTRLMGLGSCEWETYMKELLVKAITDAREKGVDTADVTKMFSCDLIGYDEFGKYQKHQEKVVDFLLEKLFSVLSDTEKELKVTLKQ